MQQNLAIRVTQCPDPMRWYSDHIGCWFPVLRIHDDEFKTREPAGFTNFVLRGDCDVVELPAYQLFSEADRENNAVTRAMTGSAISRVEGIAVYASEFRDGRGARAEVVSASRPGFPEARFEAGSWQEAFIQAAEYRDQFLSADQKGKV